ncbi:D-TA family PLP-dependent enzyme [Flavisolibacter nicotianae]|uniref:D-TA family PLP-dependent enzyme n=1 Tax=Flavisolibacter nicotianae TaxID=2364882 RepID=UPI000EB01BCD|nr:D-TA family PLP-dependent enzyme [Flavisolibacter nicotianae]
MSDQEQKPWYEILNIDQLDSPAFVIYLERVKENIAQAIKMVGDVQRLRPHVKTHKSTDVTRLMLDAGITKFKCATIAEAEMLGVVGAPDVLLAYQPVGPKVNRFLDLINRYSTTRFSCLVDNLDAARSLSRIAIERKLNLAVYIDLNVGMNRTGLLPGEEAITLFQAVAKLEGINPIGLHAYDGHIGEPDLELRTKKCSEAFSPVRTVKKVLADKGHRDLVIVAGGSPTFPIHAKNGEVECSPGTFVYWDYGYQKAFPEQPFQPAALVVSRIISLPGGDLLCADLGHKAVAAENPLDRRVRFVNAPELAFVGQSEEHLVLRNIGPDRFAIGDVLYGMPMHVCPTCALYERAYVVENGRVKQEWKTIARDRKINL